ncbi:MAG: phenylpyruvate tautomerase MIF-related protein [Verrucomicrobiota bacterium]
MPLLRLHTNYEISEDRKPKLLRLLSKIVQTEAAKPESTVMIAIHSSSAMFFAGDEKPAAFVEFKAIGIDASQTTKLSGAICAALEQDIGIPSKRIYIHFENVEGGMWGWDKQTFQTLKKGLSGNRSS